MNKYIFTIILFFLFSMSLFSDGIPKDYCLNDDEYKLFMLINEFRNENELSVIPLSASLSFVARTHAKDIFTYHPDTSICNLHSWSDKGNWTACCYNKYVKSQECMWEKPKELTNYNDKGYELIYFENDNTLKPENVINLWKKVKASSEMILTSGKWKNFDWNAIGVGIYEGYAFVWLGELTDNEDKPDLCNPLGNIIENESSESKNSIIKNKTGKFYLIVGSFSKESEAKNEFEQLKKRNFINLKILYRNKKYSVSISDNSDISKVKKVLEKYSSKFKDAWILKF
ncbi:MAG: SPOR domain-containing protein [Bacteroidales bacterium]|nr:SPOR domain-containing protein [Bacteroidales bacterium]